jgi:hypothetical protein
MRVDRTARACLGLQQPGHDDQLEGPEPACLGFLVRPGGEPARIGAALQLLAENLVQLGQGPIAAKLADALARLGHVLSRVRVPASTLRICDPDKNTRVPSCSGVIPARVLW